jgi:hypothetical protein
MWTCVECGTSDPFDAPEESENGEPLCCDCSTNDS